MTKLFLDDMRPAPMGWTLVRSYTEFVDHITNIGVPEVISFDHDLGFEHYPLAEQNPGDKIPYESYTEKTGYHCAKWLIENKPEVLTNPLIVVVHSFNIVGARNIAQLFIRYTDANVLMFPYKLPFVDIDKLCPKLRGTHGNNR